MNETYDVIIIGTGAGGGTLLHRLAPSGRRILVIERGEFLPRERENWDQHEVCTKGRYQADEEWLDVNNTPFKPYTHYWVGGNTKMYGAALLRLRESDFGEVRHMGGVSPAWPVSYDDFEPYYSEAERLYHVHARAGADPNEPRRSGPFPHPPLPYEPHMARFAEALAGQGVRPFPCPLGVRMAGDHGRGPAPVRLSLFDGYPDPTQTKADAEVCAVAPALDRSNVTLITGAKAERLITDATGRRITGVVVSRGGRTSTYHGRIVVLACGAINSAALLLRSACDAHPRGVGNHHGMVGRNYMCHNNGMVIAVSREENPSTFQKAFAIGDYYRRGVREGDPPLGLIQLMGKPDADFLASVAGPLLRDVLVRDLWRHTMDFFITAEDLPDPENRVEVTADGRIRVVYRETNRAAYDALREQLVTLLARVGPSADGAGRWLGFLGPKLGVSGVSHQCGTLRFGVDPDTTVLDLSCRVHTVDNLYAADSSFFPSSGAVNPSLTIMANALRVGDILLDRLGEARPPRALAGVGVC